MVTPNEDMINGQLVIPNEVLFIFGLRSQRDGDSDSALDRR
jgi:hypothetical protein